MTNKKKQKPRKIKTNIDALLPRPKPVSWKDAHYYIEHAREYPIMGTWLMEGWKETGLTPVVVARRQTEDKVIFGVFMVDFYCLGVKNAYCNGDFPLKRFQSELETMCSGQPEACDPGLAHELIYGGIEFARGYGFEPHTDFNLASKVLDPSEAWPKKYKLIFGKDGKPLFVSGPYDNVDRIMAKLRRTAGDGNFDFLIGFPENEGLEEE
jgi:hypothetical protein